MSLELHSMRPSRGARTKKTRLGRGNASGRGTTAGRGTKGQRARTGGRKRHKLKGLKQMLLAFPKSRGFKSGHATVYAVPMDRIMKVFTDGSQIDLPALKKARLIPNSAVLAKIIASGDVTKKVTLVGIRTSTSVKAAIEKAGGSVVNKGSKS